MMAADWYLFLGTRFVHKTRSVCSLCVRACESVTSKGTYFFSSSSSSFFFWCGTFIPEARFFSVMRQTLRCEDSCRLRKRRTGRTAAVRAPALITRQYCMVFLAPFLAYFLSLIILRWICSTVSWKGCVPSKMSVESLVPLQLDAQFPFDDSRHTGDRKVVLGTYRYIPGTYHY